MNQQGFRFTKHQKNFQHQKVKVSHKNIVWATFVFLEKQLVCFSGLFLNMLGELSMHFCLLLNLNLSRLFSCEIFKG